MIKTYFYLVSLFAMLFINIAVQAQKIEGAGIPPSKVQAYSDESAQYTVSGLEGRLTWDVTYGFPNPKFGFNQTEITWNVTPEGKIVVRNEKGESVEATIQIAPLAPKFISDTEIALEFSDIKNSRYYQWTFPSGCTDGNGKGGTFREEKLISNNNVIMFVKTPKQLYYEGNIKVQAISDKNSLLSRNTTYKLKRLDISYLNITAPEKIDYDNNQKTYTIAIDNIAGAKYKWQTSNGAIISGQNTSKVTFKPNKPYPYYDISVDLSLNNITKTKNISIEVVSNEYGIIGPTEVYSIPVEYSVKLPPTPPASIPKLMWTLNGKNGFESKFVVSPSDLNTGENILSVMVVSNYPSHPGFILKKTITKLSGKGSNKYSISYDKNSKILKTSLNQDSDYSSQITNQENTLIQIYNQQGILIKTKEINKNLLYTDIDLSNINKGVYFVVIDDGSSKTKKSFIVN